MRYLNSLILTHLRSLCYLILLGTLIITSAQAQTFNYGTGSVAANAAPFGPGGGTNVTVVGNDATVTGNVNMTAGTYHFTNFTINAGAVVTVTGTGAPLIIKCTGTFENNGTLSVNGANGATPANGTTATNPTPIVTGIAGGANSGRGGGPASSGTANRATIGSPFGTSTGGGRTPCNSATYTVPSWGGPGGGGGSYGALGTAGTNGAGQGTGCAAGGGAGTATYGDPTLTTAAGAGAAFFSPGQTVAGDRWILGGSGGAGGAGTQSIIASARAAGGSGGTGGGGVQITANNIISGTNGIIRARGGNGGNGNLSSSSNAAGGGGGGGSGGTINLQYMSSYVQNNANATLRLDVRGGLGGFGPFGTTGTGGDGGAGGAGRLLVEQDIMLCVPPAVSASSFGSSGVTASSATINWTRGDGDQVLVIVREGAAVSGGPVSATSYTANSDFTLGDALGGGRVVYIGAGTSVNVTNLPNLNTTYHVAVFEFFTAGGGCYQNLANALTGSFITDNGPMTYVSSTNVQQTGNSPLGSTNQPILRFEVVGGPGTSPALTCSSITFNTTGTTNVADLTGARMFYTGSSTTFSTATPFGGNITNPSGTHTVNGTQTLVPGANYFWLVYDVSIGATPGNLMDAQITSVDVGSAQTPSVTDPSGTRTITSLMSLSCGYTFAHFTPTWTSNVGQPGTAVIASGAASIDDQRWPGQSFAPGFSFEYNGNVYNSFGVHSKGYIWFGAANPSGLSATPISSALGYEGAIAPFAFDMVAHSASSTTPQVTVRYTGTAPNRVCIIEWTAFRPWNNTGGLCSLLGNPTDWNRYDVQLHLYENGGTNGNRIEFVYRDMNGFCVNGNGATAQVGLRGATNTDFLNRQGSGNTAHTASSAGTLNTNTITHGANNYFNGTGGMRFTPTFQKPLVSPSPTATNTCPDVTVDLTTTSPVTIKQWYRDNLALLGATSSVYTADASGVHIVVVSQGGCSKVSDPVTVTISAPQTWYLDGDNDGYAVSTTEAICSPGAGYTNAVLPLGDCNDADGAVNPGATEICSNGIDDDCDGFTDEGCGPPPTNDNRAFAINVVSYEINTCYPVTGTVTGATVSPESNSAAVTGEDVWYRFTATGVGIRIVLQGNAFDGIIELQDALGNTLESENAVSGTGSEILNHYNAISPLTIGQTYFFCIRNANSAGGTGTFNVCLQRIRATSCNIGAGPHQMCGNFKAQWVGAAGYNFTFTNTTTLQQTNATTTNGITITPFSVLLPGQTYSVDIVANYVLNNGAGQPEAFAVISNNACTFTMASQTNIELRAADWCTNGPKPVNAQIAANTWLCGASFYEWRFKQTAPLVDVDYGTPIAGAPTNRFFNLFAAGLVPGATYDVEVRPVFPGNTPGAWSTTPRCLQLIGPASMEWEGESIAHQLNSHGEPRLVVYPNPNNGQRFNLYAECKAEVVRVRILDITGREVHMTGWNRSESPILELTPAGSLPSGVYTIELLAGDVRITRRVVVQQ
jgi:hypothetical protein